VGEFPKGRCRGLNGPAHTMERVNGIEPSSKAWEAFVLPLNYTRMLALYLNENGSYPEVIALTINGQSRSFSGPLNVARLIEELELKGKRLALERNGEIVPRSQFDQVALADGDALEIVVAVGGG
jgi:sulfur carrier protein